MIIEGICWETGKKPLDPEILVKSDVIPYWKNVRRPTVDKRRVRLPKELA